MRLPLKLPKLLNLPKTELREVESGYLTVGDLIWYYRINRRWKIYLPEHPGMFSCPRGWYHIIDDYFAAVNALQRKQDFRYKTTQVKEKFGGLRIYDEHTCPPDLKPALQDFKSSAQGRADKTCTLCGGAGQFCDSGWADVLCSECFTLKEKEK